MNYLAFFLGFVLALLTLPIWAPPLDSVVNYALTKSPAACFSHDTITVGLGINITSCGDWRHCYPTESENVAHGYLCSKIEGEF